MESIKEISNILKKIDSAKEIQNFLLELLTESEVETLSKRWHIVKMLIEGKTQRDIAEELNVSLCNITRGAKILKNKDSVIIKKLKKEIKNERIKK